jgi:hypothetical protein
MSSKNPMAPGRKPGHSAFATNKKNDPTSNLDTPTSNQHKEGHISAIPNHLNLGSSPHKPQGRRLSVPKETTPPRVLRGNMMIHLGKRLDLGQIENVRRIS